MEILRALSREDETPEENERKREGSLGYASASSSLNSSRKTSNTATRSAQPDWTSMFAAIGSAVAVGAAAYVAYKTATSEAQATMATTVTECMQQVEKIKKYLNLC